MDKDQFRNYLTKAFPEHIPREDHEQFDFVLGIQPTFSEERELSSSRGGVQTKDSPHNTESGPTNSVISNQKTTSNKFGKYSRKEFPGHILGEDHEQFDFALGIGESPLSGGGVSTKDSTVNTESSARIPVLSTKKRDKRSSASNASNTSLFHQFPHGINMSIAGLKKIQKKRNTSMNTPPEDTYNVLVVCSDENKNSDYDRFRNFISDRFYDRNKKIITTFLNARNNFKRYPQDVKDAQYHNHFDMIWFAGCILLNEVFNDRFLQEDDPPMYTVQRTYDILKEDGIVIFTEDSSEFNPTIKVENMFNMGTDPRNMDIPIIFKRYFTEMEETDTGTVFYNKKYPPQPTGPSSGDSSSSTSVQPRTMTTSSSNATSMSISPSIRNSKPEKTFSDFLDDAIGLTEHMKTQLRDIFKDPDWTVYDPPGDGFCTIHAIYKDLGEDTNNKDFLVNELYRAMKTYINTTVDEKILIRPDVKYHTIGEYNFRNQETANETKENLRRYIQNRTLPDDIERYYNQKRQNKNQTTIDIQELYNILKDSFKDRTGPFEKEDVIRIEDVENVMLTKQDFQGQKEKTTKEFLRSLENSNDLGTELVQYFPYITGHNILYITVLQDRREPKIDYYEGPRDSATPPQNTILFNWSGHTVLLQNTDEKKNALVKPYVPKFSAQQVNKAVKLLGCTSDIVQNMSRETYNEIMNPVN